MANTKTQVKGPRSTSGTIREEFFDLAISSYTNTGGVNGEAVTARDFGLLEIYGIQVVGANTAGSAYRAVYNNQTGKIMLYSGASEVANATNAGTFRLRVTGI